MSICTETNKNRDMIFCTLFNSGYLDRGLLMYESLKEACDNDFRLYVIAFDEDSYRVLSEIEDKNLITISRGEFESPEIVELKESRSAREYMWTCSSLSIEYVLEKYKEDSCTYIDADLYFYSSPRRIFDEIETARADVAIMEHGYVDVPENIRYINYSGKYCVEFNFFRNNDNGRRVLAWWRDSCIECCQELQDGIHFGDQKYLEQFLNLFNNVYVIQNEYSGIAPWNLAKYRYIDDVNGIPRVVDYSNTSTPEFIIFFHFQQISFLSQNLVDIHAHMYPRKIDKLLCDRLYVEYVYKLLCKRSRIKEDYDIDLWKCTEFATKERFVDFLGELFKYERNIEIFLRRLLRWILYRKNDYVSII